MRKKSLILLALAALILVQAPGCAAWRGRGVTPYPGADRLFRCDPRWRGGDGAGSVPLSGGRVLWLFGDSFVCPGAACSREASTLVRNTVGIQEGLDPASAPMAFYWREREGEPRAFFEKPGPGWLWPGSGERAGKSLLVFLMRVVPDDNPLGFRSEGWDAVRVEGPEGNPLDWNLQWPAVPETRGVLVGSGAALVHGGYLVAFGVRESGERGVYAVRFDLADAARGDLSRPQWCRRGEWVPGENLQALPEPLFTGGQNEFSVIPSASGLVLVQSAGFGSAGFQVRTAPAPCGPWSAPAGHDLPARGISGPVLLYSVKAHPGLSGPGTVLTFCVNTLDPERLMTDPAVYYPRFFVAGPGVMP